MKSINHININRITDLIGFGQLERLYEIDTIRKYLKMWKLWKILSVKSFEIFERQHSLRNLLILVKKKLF